MEWKPEKNVRCLGGRRVEYFHSVNGKTQRTFSRTTQFRGGGRGRGNDVAKATTRSGSGFHRNQTFELRLFHDVDNLYVDGIVR